MEIKVDQTLCSGHARCNAFAPEVYELDDNGFCAVTFLHVGVESEEAAREGAEACPERAITVTE
jgi:ferredoxin